MLFNWPVTLGYHTIRFHLKFFKSTLAFFISMLWPYSHYSGFKMFFSLLRFQNVFPGHPEIRFHSIKGFWSIQILSFWSNAVTQANHDSKYFLISRSRSNPLKYFDKNPVITQRLLRNWTDSDVDNALATCFATWRLMV